MLDFIFGVNLTFARFPVILSLLSPRARHPIKFCYRPVLYLNCTSSNQILLQTGPVSEANPKQQTADYRPTKARSSLTLLTINNDISFIKPFHIIRADVTRPSPPQLNKPRQNRTEGGHSHQKYRPLFLAIYQC